MQAKEFAPSPLPETQSGANGRPQRRRRRQNAHNLLLLFSLKSKCSVDPRRFGWQLSEGENFNAKFLQCCCCWSYILSKSQKVRLAFSAVIAVVVVVVAAARLACPMLSSFPLPILTRGTTTEDSLQVAAHRRWRPTPSLSDWTDTAHLSFEWLT